MIVDARAIPNGETLAGDVCIVGGGAAGITIALGLIDQPARVVFLESGGVREDDAGQALNRGTTIGRSYYPLDACRLRYLGGSTNFWGGWCRPLDALDFEEHDWMPFSGWPFNKYALDPFYERAQSVCGLTSDEFDASAWREGGDGGIVSRNSTHLQDTVFQIKPLRFGREYRARLQGARNVRLLLHANALDVEMDASQRTAVCVRAATVGGNRFAVTAKVFVLAAGGIENPRILLASRAGRNCGIGDEHDLVGRFFTEHLHVPIGIVTPKQCDLGFYRPHRARGATIRGGMSLTEEARRSEQLPGCALTLHNVDDPHDVLRPTNQPDGYASMRVLTTSLRRLERPERLWHHVGNLLTGFDSVVALSYRKLVSPPALAFAVGVRAEQAPHPDSRVTLDDAVDCFGVPRVKVDWRVTDEDLAKLRHAQCLCLSALDRARVDVDPVASDGQAAWSEPIAGAVHHMGTTRMHRDPKKGVVDEHCRVHGTSNLYVAGSSVFPTAGWAPPTMTIVALALRLADRIKERLCDE